MMAFLFRIFYFFFKMAALYFKSDRPPIPQFEPTTNLFYIYLFHEDPDYYRFAGRHSLFTDIVL